MPAHGYGNIYNCASCLRALLATSDAAPYRALWSLVRLLRNVGRRSLLPVGLLLIGHSSHWCGCSAMLGCAHATVSVRAATKRRVAKDMALHVQYLLKSILCNSHKQIQQLTTTQQPSALPFVLGPLPIVSSWLSNHQGGHQGYWTLVDQ